MTTRWLVVGAGSAGAVLAARISEDPAAEVTLLESGPDASMIDQGPSFFAALDEPGRTHDSLMAVRVEGQPPVPYRRGRGVGGSGAVNAMIALRGGPFDAEHLIHTEVALPAERGAVDRALLAAADDAVPVPLSRRDGRRVTVADAYLDAARDRPNLTVVTGAHVDRVELDGRRATGVRLDEGELIGADRVVLSAGAVHSPAILLRSSVDTPGVGHGLKDHPSAPLTLALHPEAVAEPASLAVSTVLLRGDVQVLPLNHLGAEAPGLGLLMPALMRVRSEGAVTLADRDPHVHPRVEFRMLAHPDDLAGLVDAVEIGLELLDHAAFREIVDAVYVDAFGTTVDALRTREAIARWLPANVGDYVHAACSCRMGTVVDDHCRVFGYDRLYVCDASAFPDIPLVNTHIPTVMLAETMAARWSHE